MINWTLEEESILNIYNHGSRLSTLSAIEEVLPYLGDDPDMRRILDKDQKNRDARNRDVYFPGLNNSR